MTASREDLCLRLEAGAKAAAELAARLPSETVVGLTLDELAAALRSEAALALGRPSLVNLHLVRVADILTGAPPWTWTRTG